MQTVCVYLFAILCATVTAQYDELSILEEILDRTTISTVEVEPEYTVEFGTNRVRTSSSSSTAGPTVPEVTTTTAEEIKYTKSTPSTKTTRMEKSGSGKTDENIAPLVSTPIVEPSPSSTTESPMTTPAKIRISAKPKSESSTTEKTSTEDKTEIPLVEKETILGLKPDLSRIYRRLFPYRNI